MPSLLSNYSFFKYISHCVFVVTRGTLTRLIHLSHMDTIRHSWLQTPAMQELQGWCFSAAHSVHRARIRQLLAHNRGSLGSRVFVPACRILAIPGSRALQDPGSSLEQGTQECRQILTHAQNRSQEGSRAWRGTTMAPTYGRTQHCFTRLFTKKRKQAELKN